MDSTIHNPARLMIILLLNQNEALDYLDLMNRTGLTSGNITTHLTKLSQGGYIKIRKSFINNKPNTSVQLTDKGRKAYRMWGEAISQVLPGSVLRGIKAQILNTLIGQHSHVFTNSEFLLDGRLRSSLVSDLLIQNLSLPPMLAPNVW